MRRRERGGTLVESAVMITAFLLLIAGVMDFSLIGFAYNSVCYASHRAARFAAVRGSRSAHPALTADVQAEALAYITCLDTTKLTVAVTWTPDKNPGSNVQVKVSYLLKPLLIPISATTLTLESTTKQMIVQ